MSGSGERRIAAAFLGEEKRMQDSQIIRTEYSDVMKKSYIDYAMSVIIARALPDVRDGLKPVQRRKIGRAHV